MNLFDEETMKNLVIATKRPSFDDGMYHKLAIIAAGCLNIDLSEEDEEEKESILTTIKKVLYNNEYDGYQLGKDFDYYGFEIDASIVSELDCLHVVKNNILNEAIEAWVISNYIEPKLRIGDKVKCEIKGKLTDGEIVDINIKRAYYIVKTIDYVGNGGYIIKYEDIKL